MGTELPVQGSASHAKKDAELWRLLAYNTPRSNCSLQRCSALKSGLGWPTLQLAHPAIHRLAFVKKSKITFRTWIPCLTIRTHIIPRHILYQILQSTLIARLLTLAQRRRHSNEKLLAGRGLQFAGRQLWLREVYNTCRQMYKRSSNRTAVSHERCKPVDDVHRFEEGTREW